MAVCAGAAKVQKPPEVGCQSPESGQRDSRWLVQDRNSFVLQEPVDVY